MHDTSPNPPRRKRHRHTIVDDRGTEVTADSEALSHAMSAEAKKSWWGALWYWGGLTWLVYCLYTVASRPASFIPTSPLYLGLIAAAAFWSFLRSYLQSRNPPPVPRLSAALLSLGNCGGCAYALDPVPLAPDGLRQCPECGCAWHPDRPVFPSSTPVVRQRLLKSAVVSSGMGVGEVDDRNVPLRETFQWPRPATNLAPLPSTPIALQLNAGVRRRTGLAALALLGAWAGGITLWLLLSDPYDRATALVIVLTFILLIVAIVVAHRWPVAPAKIRSIMLGHGACPSCRRWMVERKPQFDGCTICQSCRAAWKATDLGPVPVTTTDANARKDTV